MSNKLEAIESLYNAIERAGMTGQFRFREVSQMADVLRNAGNTLRRIHETECNGIERWDPTIRERIAQWTVEDQEQAYKKIDKLRAKAQVVVDNMNAEAFTKGTFILRFNSDPRGPAIKLFVSPENPESGNPSASF